ncbi:MAG: glucosidase [Gemmataceae bacterium]
MPTIEFERMCSPGPWRLWGPYLSDRQWGTVREDYSANGDAWRYLPHDHARSRAYRWGEDGLLGISDDQQRLCLSLALWNGRDEILKERLFGLANEEGNHGEDVKELYFQIDAVPSHSYLKGLYKYPQRAFPYSRLYDENRRRTRNEPEFELLDTGLFDDNRYFDCFVEYAKGSPTDLVMRITVCNRGPDAADLHVLPTLWFRNTWSWVHDAIIPELRFVDGQVIAKHPTLGDYTVTADGSPDWIFCDNETNAKRLFHAPGPQYPKDAFHDYVVANKRNAVNPQKTGTKCAAHYSMKLAAGETRTITLRLSQNPTPKTSESILETSIREADAYYADIQYSQPDEDMRRVQRQAFAGLIWNKQFFHLDVERWLTGDPTQPPPPPNRESIRNGDWTHLDNADVISMPDKWEYPWYAAWDLAFHMIPFARIDPDFAKNQLLLFTRERFSHPNGQLPAYEWNFGDVNPPVHAWSCWRVFQIDRKMRRSLAKHKGEKYEEPGDLGFLERVFHKLMMNFTWWVNKKDAAGRNIFQGGFLGMDNVGVFDRSKPLPTGGYIDQADGTAWMAMYSLTLMRIALELARFNPVYQDVAIKFFEHFLAIAKAMADFGETGHGLWNDEDEFYYDELNLPDGQRIPLKVRSLVGLVPLFAVETLDPKLLDQVPEFKARLEWLLANKPDLSALVSRWTNPGLGERRLLSLLRGSRMKKLLKRMLDESEFLSPYGIRSLSKAHEKAPYTFHVFKDVYSVQYMPGESDSGMFGGNSNWRGPIWFPMNYLLVESLQKFHHYYGPEFKVECPTGSGKFMTIEQVAEELSHRLCRIFLRSKAGHRPAFGSVGKFQTDPHFKDFLQFHEYFNGDTGEGLGASHQCGWTAIVAKLLQNRVPDTNG